jgi:hypothetical protein|eukprot:7383801-Prymnesium_polylepis.2
MAYEDGVVWVKDHRRIAARYLSTWFIIDLVSQANLVFDFIALDSSNSSDDYYILLRIHGPHTSARQAGSSSAHFTDPAPMEESHHRNDYEAV